MIYASLRTVLRWYHPLTPWVYLALSVCGGLITLNAWEQIIVGQSSLIEITTIGLVIAFGVSRFGGNVPEVSNQNQRQKLQQVSDRLVRSIY